MLDKVGADLTNSPRLVGINQRIVRGNRQSFIDRWQLEPDRQVRCNRGANFDRLGYFCKAGLFDFELVDAIGQALHVQLTLTVGCERVVIAIGLASNLDRGLYGRTGRIGNGDAQFSVVALRANRGRAQNENHQESLHVSMAPLWKEFSLR